VRRERVGVLNHRAAGYVGRILKGEKPADLPAGDQPQDGQGVLDIAMPPALLARADEVIE
jgi:hypothetical protein